MIDFSLQDINTDHPSLWSVAYVMLMAFSLSSLMALVYHLTTPRTARLGQFIQTMILGSMGAAVIVLAIGDSLGRGLGILGALAIIRFRTTLRQQRDIVFIFCTLGIGMACGMYGFNIAVIGAISFSALALLFRMTPLHGLPEMKHQLRVTYPLESGLNPASIESILKKHTVRYRCIRQELTKEGNTRTMELYFLLNRPASEAKKLIEELDRLGGNIQFRLWSREEIE